MKLSFKCTQQPFNAPVISIIENTTGTTFTTSYLGRSGGSACRITAAAPVFNPDTFCSNQDQVAFLSPLQNKVVTLRIFNVTPNSFDLVTLYSQDVPPAAPVAGPVEGALVNKYIEIQN